MRRGAAIILGFRLVLLVNAMAAVVAAAWMTRFRGPAEADARLQYGCPMHPEVTSATPGQCPICGMDLERLRTSGAAPPSSVIDPSTYLAYDITRLRGIGPDSPAPAWVERDGDISAILYKDELEGLLPEARGWFYASAATTDAGISVRAVPGTSEPWDRSTSRVRFRMDGDGASRAREQALTPGSVGRVRLIDRGREVPVISSSAILEGTDGPYVLVASPDGRMLIKRTVQIGKVFGGLAFILSGIGSGERVLTRSAFFVDVERRLRHEAAIEVKR